MFKIYSPSLASNDLKPCLLKVDDCLLSQHVVDSYQQAALTSQLTLLDQSFAHHNTFKSGVPHNVDFPTAYLPSQDRHTEILVVIGSPSAVQFVTTGTAFPLASCCIPTFISAGCPSPPEQHLRGLQYLLLRSLGCSRYRSYTCFLR
ncbi:hypothetical protein PoB_001647600 [Plakobranchus ocellatus]|uniref:Uncharacterized protein n=1 Tax=Plakobranchus ocellatus TaxID=259542 RepID=A0AAV3Z2A0_9GAST|nr:hypothetical protein PoB_001647600 [Plakobranchus ocellatus]